MKRKIFAVALILMAAGLSACQSRYEEAGTDTPVILTETEQENTAETDREAVYDKDVHNTITVNSSEKVSVVPDIAEVVYSVRTQDSQAAGCQQKNSEAVSQVIELLKGLGVEETSIQTSDYYMNPVYNYSGNTPKVTGYEATTTLTVSDLPINDLDNVLAQSVLTGINTVQSITYQASQYDKSYQEALAKAVAAAYEKAAVLAEASGAKVGTVVSIQETSGYSDARYTDYARSNVANAYGAMKQAAMEDSVSIMPGEIEVEAALIAEYQLIIE